MAGKGSTPRPIPDRETYESNWERIFKDKQKDTVPITFTDSKDRDVKEPAETG